MHVRIGVRVHVMLAVLGRPPQNAALGSRLRQKGKAKLKDPTRSECTVGKVSVIPGTDRENANPIECQPEQQGMRAHPSPECCEAP
jgi:hypothetical protein